MNGVADADGAGFGLLHSQQMVLEESAADDADDAGFGP